MTLVPGTRLGPYEIVAPLGSGGMGEVYRAKDTRLGRDVAVKVLPSHLSDSPEVRARFEREAKTVSSLNHPNICTLFDVGRERDVDYLVMELVEGETLAHRLKRGALATSEVLRLGAQIADALDRAHRAGVIHRDLKPGNVMLTKSGTKLMDFGLSRAVGLTGPAGSGASAAAMTHSPTVAQPLTAEGTIVGTFQYMAPEQLEGKDADARSDLWALGCVLYEMATGKRPFEGRSQASLIGAIMGQDPPPISRIAPMTPPVLERLVGGLLAKDPDERIQTAHDVRLQLQWILDGGSQAGAPAVVTRLRRGREWAAWGLLAVVSIAAIVTFALNRRPAGLSGSLRVSVTPPENAVIDDDQMHTAISPDGAWIAFVATDSLGTSQLWVRELALPDARPLPGTQQAIIPFWSPDSRFIAFFAEGKLKKVDIGGRNVQVLCNAPDGRGGAWNSRGVIVFAPASTGALLRVSESGGPVAPATTLDTTRHERAHRFPSFLGDGTHFLHAAMGDSMVTRVASLNDRSSRSLMSGVGSAIYAAPGHVLYSRNQTLLIQRIDERAARLLGKPRAFGAGPLLSRYGGAFPASVSANGIVVQRRRTNSLAGLGWLDREGRRLSTVPAPAAQYFELSISPNDTRAALAASSLDNVSDIWTIELSRGTTTRLTVDQRFCENPKWSPDGRWIAFSSLNPPRRDIHRKLSSGAGEVELITPGLGAFSDAAGWSPDGRHLLIRNLEPETGEDVWALPVEGDRKPFPVLHSRYHEEDPSLSPDGRWLAFRSNESGRVELYVQSFPVPDAKQRVSRDGAGTQSRSPLGRAFWRRDGRELVYVGGDGVSVWSVPIVPGGSLSLGTPRLLFRIPPECFEMVATSDLQRFLVLEDRSTKESPSIQMIVNWPAGMRGE